MVAERYGLSGQTVWKWRKRDSVHDRSHTAHRLQSTLTPVWEAVAVSLRTTLLLPLDDLLSMVPEVPNPNVSRSGRDHSPMSLGPCMDGSMARALLGW